MAWKVRITEVSTTAQGEDGQGNPITIDLSLEGRFRAVAEYYDSANPDTILLTHNFDFGFGISQQDAVQRVKEVGVKVRDTRQLVANLQSQVGTELNV
jgi:hypothetical protein